MSLAKSAPGSGKHANSLVACSVSWRKRLDVKKNFGIDPKDFSPEKLLAPREDDTYSPLHDEEDDKEEKEAPAKNE